MKAINDVKELAGRKGITLTFIAKKLSERLGKNYSIDNLSKKLRNNTIKYSEMKIIAEILGYELNFKEK